MTNTRLCTSKSAKDRGVSNMADYYSRCTGGARSYRRIWRRSRASEYVDIMEVHDSRGNETKTLTN